MKSWITEGNIIYKTRNKEGNISIRNTYDKRVFISESILRSHGYSRWYDLFNPRSVFPHQSAGESPEPTGSKARCMLLQYDIILRVQIAKKSKNNYDGTLTGDIAQARDIGYGWYNR